MPESGFSASGSALVDLPVYVSTPRRSTRDEPKEPRWSDHRGRSATRLPAFAWLVRSESAASPCFSCLVDVPGDDLVGTLRSWWGWGAREDHVLVGHHLVLTAPELRQGTWTSRGRLHGARQLAIPVTVDFWRHNRFFTRLSMSPHRRVVTSRRYFAVGNAAVGHLARQLCDCWRCRRPDWESGGESACDVDCDTFDAYRAPPVGYSRIVRRSGSVDDSS